MQRLEDFTEKMNALLENQNDVESQRSNIRSQVPLWIEATNIKGSKSETRVIRPQEEPSKDPLQKEIMMF